MTEWKLFTEGLMNVMKIMEGFEEAMKEKDYMKIGKIAYAILSLEVPE